jgi:cell division protein ZapA
MPEVVVEINDRKYRMACEEGQEPHVLALAGRFNRQIDQFKDGFGEVGDNRLTVMAGLAITDELEEAEKKIRALQEHIKTLAVAGHEVTTDHEDLERRVAKRLNEVARRIEAIATAIDETGAANTGG